MTGTTTATPPTTPSANPCQGGYQELSAVTRNIDFNDGDNGEEVCDNGLVLSGDAANQDWRGPGWYRFTGAAGLDMTTTVPGLPPSWL